jgi:hypothetical protein
MGEITRKEFGARPPDHIGARQSPRIFRGLPPLEPAVVPPRHRAVLIACSETGRASWAELAPVGGGWRWIGNVPAVPVLNQAQGASGGSASATLPAGTISWGGYRCGVCRKGPPNGPGRIGTAEWWRHGCGTIMCPGALRQREVGWVATCPGCGDTMVVTGDEPYATEVAVTEGSVPRRMPPGSDPPRRISDPRLKLPPGR